MPPTASWPRRIAALFVDWFACSLAARLIFGDALWAPLGIFVLEVTVFTALIGGSFGQLVTGLRVVRVDGSGQPMNLLGSLIRSLLIAIVIPPLIFRPDGRGLHDLAVGSAAVRSADLRRA
ncbi:RDD family protein [Nocardioides sp.]|uniref:RDD family protein n=1 Tax=Nocardioides sp. TaxID=35761 RepID=UPI003D1060CD